MAAATRRASDGGVCRVEAVYERRHIQQMHVAGGLVE